MGIPKAFSEQYRTLIAFVSKRGATKEELDILTKALKIFEKYF